MPKKKVIHLNRPKRQVRKDTGIFQIVELSYESNRDSTILSEDHLLGVLTRAYLEAGQIFYDRSASFLSKEALETYLASANGAEDTRTFRAILSAIQSGKHELPEDVLDAKDVRELVDDCFRSLFCDGVGRQEPRRVPKMRPSKLPQEQLKALRGMRGLGVLKRIPSSLPFASALAACYCAFKAGMAYQRMLVRHREPDAWCGRKVRAGGRDAHVKAHGRLEEKQARWRRYQETVDRIMKVSDLGYVKACREAGRDHQVTERTIRKHTIHPKKKTGRSS